MQPANITSGFDSFDFYFLLSIERGPRSLYVDRDTDDFRHKPQNRTKHTDKMRGIFWQPKTFKFIQKQKLPQAVCGEVSAIIHHYSAVTTQMKLKGSTIIILLC